MSFKLQQTGNASPGIALVSDEELYTRYFMPYSQCFRLCSTSFSLSCMTFAMSFIERALGVGARPLLFGEMTRLAGPNDPRRSEFIPTFGGALALLQARRNDGIWTALDGKVYESRWEKDAEETVLRIGKSLRMTGFQVACEYVVYMALINLDKEIDRGARLTEQLFEGSVANVAYTIGRVMHSAEVAINLAPKTNMSSYTYKRMLQMLDLLVSEFANESRWSDVARDMKDHFYDSCDTAVALYEDDKVWRSSNRATAIFRSHMHDNITSQSGCHFWRALVRGVDTDITQAIATDPRLARILWSLVVDCARVAIITMLTRVFALKAGTTVPNVALSTYTYQDILRRSTTPAMYAIASMREESITTPQTPNGFTIPGANYQLFHDLNDRCMFGMTPKFALESLKSYLFQGTGRCQLHNPLSVERLFGAPLPGITVPTSLFNKTLFSKIHIAPSFLKHSRGECMHTSNEDMIQMRIVLGDPLVKAINAGYARDPNNTLRMFSPEDVIAALLEAVHVLGYPMAAAVLSAAPEPSNPNKTIVWDHYLKELFPPQTGFHQNESGNTISVVYIPRVVNPGAWNPDPTQDPEVLRRFGVDGRASLVTAWLDTHTERGTFFFFESHHAVSSESGSHGAVMTYRPFGIHNREDVDEEYLQDRQVVRALERFIVGQSDEWVRGRLSEYDTLVKSMGKDEVDHKIAETAIASQNFLLTDGTANIVVPRSSSTLSRSHSATTGSVFNRLADAEGTGGTEDEGKYIGEVMESFRATYESFKRERGPERHLMYMGDGVLSRDRYGRQLFGRRVR